MEPIVSVLSIELPNRTLAEEFERPLAALVALAPRGEKVRDDDVAFAAMEVVGGIEEMLSVASDAQLQGRSIWIDARMLVDALDTTRRLAFALGNLAMVDDYAVACETLDDAVSAHLESWLALLRAQLMPGALTPAPLRTMVQNAPVLDFNTMLEEIRMNESAESIAAREHIANLIAALEYQLVQVSLR